MPHPPPPTRPAHRSRPFYEKRISHEVPGDSLGDDFKGYVFRISGGTPLIPLPPLHHTHSRGHYPTATPSFGSDIVSHGGRNAFLSAA